MAELLDVNRTSVYYEQKAPSEIEILVKHKIDEMHTENPSWGSRQLSKQLKKLGFCTRVWAKIPYLKSNPQCFLKEPKK